jgi:hypothetical protein
MTFILLKMFSKNLNNDSEKSTIFFDNKDFYMKMKIEISDNKFAKMLSDIYVSENSYKDICRYFDILTDIYTPYLEKIKNDNNKIIIFDNILDRFIKSTENENITYI